VSEALAEHPHPPAPQDVTVQGKLYQAGVGAQSCCQVLTVGVWQHIPLGSVGKTQAIVKFF
jgi:hypothetical protein